MSAQPHQGRVNCPATTLPEHSLSFNNVDEMADWVSAVQCYEPDVEQASETSKAFDEFKNVLLSDDTAVRRNYFSIESKNATSEMLDEGGLDDALKSDIEDAHYEFLFVNRRFKQKGAKSSNTHKLHISSTAFQNLIVRRNLPPSFVSALSRHYLPAGRGLRISDGIHTAWHFLPLRVQVNAKKSSSATTSSTARDNQMNPFHYLSLPDINVEIRGACIGIYSSHCPVRRTSKFVVINFLSGNWPKIVEEPQVRIREVVAHASKPGESGDGGFVYLVYLSNIVRWWTNALNSVNEQLISYEKQLQEEMDRDEAPSTEFYTRINRALHTVAAHLHRYSSELKSLEESTHSLQSHQKELASCMQGLQDSEGDRIFRGLEQVLSQIKASINLAIELEKKSTNILALLFNGMHIISDRQALENGRRMEKILEATQDETRIAGELAKQNQTLAEDMKNDSLAMKTVAIVTMFFLPGATFATLLSMPFFSENPWMQDATRIWVWFALTIPTTIVAFWFYLYYRRRRRNEQNTTKACV